MNLFKKLHLIATGPYPRLFIYYGEWLWIYVFFNQLNLFEIAVLTVLHLAFNLYQLQTEAVITNGKYKLVPEEIATQIKMRIERDNLPSSTTQEIVTNIPTVNAFCERTINNTKIILSHHWLENDALKEVLIPVLEHEFAHARRHHNLKRSVYNSIFFLLGQTFVYLILTYIFPELNNTFYWFCFSSIAFRATTFLQTFLSQYHEYEADRLALMFVAPEQIIQLLETLKKHCQLEQIREQQPWWFGTHPKISDRILAISNDHKQRADKHKTS
jgi:Zn-dependent protease with chaperone function